MNYEVFADKQFPNDWRAEAIGDDGDCYVVVFSGPNAEQRAREYAQFELEKKESAPK